MQFSPLIARLTASLALAIVAVACSDPEKQKVAHLERGNEYAAEGRDEFAVIEYARAVQLDPRYGEARLKLAETHERRNDLRAAAGEYIRAADALPDNRDVQIKATQMLLLGGRFEDAKTRATVLLEKNPEDLEAILLRASAMALLRDPAGAIAEVEEALSLRPGDSLALATLGNLQMQAGDAAQAEAAFRQAIAMAPDSVDAHLAFANFLFSAERQAEAEQMLSMALAIDPKHLLANRMLAVFYMATDRAREAESPLKIVAESSKTPDSQFQLADYYVSVDRRDEARQLLLELVKEPRAFAQAETRLATLARDEGAAEEAHKRVDGVLARLPNYVPALVAKAQWLAADDKLDEALTRATAAVTADPDSATAHFTLGSIHQRRREVDEAIKSYNEVLRLNPRALAAQVELSRLNLVKGDVPAAVRFGEDARSTAPDSNAARLVVARAMLASGNLAGAETNITALLKTAPDEASVQTLHGLLLARRGNLGAARTSFTRALELAPGDAGAIEGLLGLDIQSKQIGPAIARIEGELAKSPDRTELLALAARVYVAAEQHDRAEAALRHAVAADPNFFNGYMMLAALYMQQQRTDDARREFERIVERDPKAIGPRTMIGVLLEGQNRRDEARKWYESTVAMSDSAHVAANNLAYLYAQEGINLDEALQLATSAKQRLPDNYAVDDTLGWIYYKKDLPQLAVGPFEESLKKKPDDPEVLYHLGLTHAKLGNHAAARDALGRALKLQPDFPGNDEARRALASLPR